jgi:signal transduction histidine kinase
MPGLPGPEVFREAGTIIIEAQDNGKGISPNEQRKGIGLKTIWDRVALLAGTLNIDSHSGKGTLVTTLRLPIGNG